jgi:hypothetical protein
VKKPRGNFRSRWQARNASDTVVDADSLFVNIIFRFTTLRIISKVALTIFSSVAASAAEPRHFARGKTAGSTSAPAALQFFPYRSWDRKALP